MPAKSGRGGRRGKYSYQSKKQGAQGQPGAVRQPAAAQAEPSPISARVAAPRPAPARQTRKVADMIKPSAIRYALVPKELKTIGILAGVILVLLIVLARVLA
ncbi:MAG: hypothetical protein HYX80_10175 [Chloroflexi bacterium]|nr:hypothetical protein [Chloroflexota bacterium]